MCDFNVYIKYSISSQRIKISFRFNVDIKFKGLIKMSLKYPSFSAILTRVVESKQITNKLSEPIQVCGRLLASQARGFWFDPCVGFFLNLFFYFLNSKLDRHRQHYYKRNQNTKSQSFRSFLVFFIGHAQPPTLLLPLQMTLRTNCPKYGS